MAKKTGFFNLPILLGVILAISLTLGTYLVMSPLSNPHTISYGTIEEEYSSETAPSPTPTITQTFADIINLIPILPDPTPTLRPHLVRKPVPTPTSVVTTINPTPIALTSPQGGTSNFFDTEYYDIYGDEEHELREEMNEKGHLDEDGEMYDAYTYWNISWNYLYKQTANVCSAESIDVTVDVTIHLPRWENQSGGSASLKSKWEQYIDDLTLHEEGHRAFADEGGQKVYETLSQIGAYPTCDELKNKVSEKGQAVIEEVRSKNKQYDDETSHGLTQGAVFP